MSTAKPRPHAMVTDYRQKSVVAFAILVCCLVLLMLACWQLAAGQDEIAPHEGAARAESMLAPSRGAAPGEVPVDLIARRAPSKPEQGAQAYEVALRLVFFGSELPASGLHVAVTPAYGLESPLQIALRNRQTPGSPQMAASDGAGVANFFLPPGRFRVELLDDTHFIVPKAEFAVETSNCEVILQVAVGGALTGRVLDEKGEAIVGAAVAVQRQTFLGANAYGLELAASTNLVMTSTDSTGRYWLRGIPSQSKLTVAAQAPGLAPAALQDCHVEDGRTGELPDLVLGAGATLQVTVRHAPGLQPTEVEVAFRPTQETLFNLEQTVRIAGEGVVNIDNISKGTYHVLVWSAHSQPVELVAKLETGKICQKSVLLVPGAVLGGRVVDSRGRPVSGARVVGHHGTIKREAMTNRDGAFLLTGLRDSTVSLVATAPAYVDSPPKRVAAKHGELVELVLQDPASLTGAVFDELGEPLAGCHVTLEEVRSGLWPPPKSHVVFSDASGKFLFTGLQSGRYRVAAMTRDRMAAPQVCHLDVGATVSCVLTAASRPRLTGRVVGSESRLPLPGARIEVTEDGQPGGVASIMSSAIGMQLSAGHLADAKGQFTILASPSMSVLRVRHSGYSVATIDVGVLRSGRDVDLGDIALTLGCRISGVISGIEQLPAGEIQVVAFASEPSPVPVAVTKADAQRRFDISGLDGGKYTMGIVYQGVRVLCKKQVVNLVESSHVHDNVVLPNMISARIGLIGPQDESIMLEGAMEDDLYRVTFTWNNIGGGFELPPMPNGRYSLRIRHSDGSASALPDSVSLGEIIAIPSRDR